MDMDLESPSYMEMKLHLEGESAKVLRIPTFWDSIHEQWIGAIKTPITKKLIYASGKDSFELQNNFNKEIYKAFESELSKEILNMFKEEGYG